jgi:hypothetical protein
VFSALCAHKSNHHYATSHVTSIIIIIILISRSLCDFTPSSSVPNATQTSCEGKPCSESLCCLENPTCASTPDTIECPPGRVFVTAPSTVDCAGAECLTNECCNEVRIIALLNHACFCHARVCQSLLDGWKLSSGYQSYSLLSFFFVSLSLGCVLLNSVRAHVRGSGPFTEAGGGRAAG